MRSATSNSPAGETSMAGVNAKATSTRCATCKVSWYRLWRWKGKTFCEALNMKNPWQTTEKPTICEKLLNHSTSMHFDARTANFLNRLSLAAQRKLPPSWECRRGAVGATAPPAPPLSPCEVHRVPVGLQLLYMILVVSRQLPRGNRWEQMEIPQFDTIWLSLSQNLWNGRISENGRISSEATPLIASAAQAAASCVTVVLRHVLCGAPIATTSQDLCIWGRRATFTSATASHTVLDLLRLCALWNSDAAHNSFRLFNIPEPANGTRNQTQNPDHHFDGNLLHRFDGFR